MIINVISALSENVSEYIMFLNLSKSDEGERQYGAM